MRTRYLLPLLMLAALAAPLAAAPGDTTRVRVFDSLLWKEHGGQSRWALFPDASKRFEKILMHFRLECPSGGCGEWDYTMSVYVRRHTGVIDSAIQKAPSFRVDGAVRDSVPISLDTTWTSRYTQGRTDSTLNAPMTIVYFGDPVDPWLPTDTITVWPAGYYNYRYGTGGVKTDSSYVDADSILRVTLVDDYVPFEVVEPIEIARFITPYGKYYAKGREFDWVYDVTDYAYLLRDSVEIHTFYDGWSQGSIYTLDFDLVEGIPTRDVFRVENLYTGGFPYGNPDNPIENHLPERTVTIDPASTNTTLRIVTTGHGFGGTDNAAEFSERTHAVKVDGTKRFDQHLWRADCGQNPVYPQAGTWYYPRAGWCPGDIVHPFFYDLTPFVTAGETARIDYDMEPYVNADLSHPATYFVHAQVLYATGPNFANNAIVEEIRVPSDEFRFRRMNPICGTVTRPTFVLKNGGSERLRSATIRYGVEGGEEREMSWTGDLGFMESQVVELEPVALGLVPGTFNVSVASTNGATDDNARDNAMRSAFQPVKAVGGRIYFQLRTDDFFDEASETSNGIEWMLLDDADRIVESGEGYEDRTTYRDTFDLPNGCYRFVIRDMAYGDGLIPIRGTAGNYSLRSSDGTTIHSATSGSPNFFAGFGDREVISFAVAELSSADDESVADGLGAIALYPNPSDGTFTIDLGALGDHGELVVTVTDLAGREVLRRTIDADSASVAIGLEDRPAGTYVVKVTGDGGAWLRKIVLEPR